MRDDETGELVTVDWLEDEEYEAPDETVPAPETWNSVQPVQPNAPKEKPFDRARNSKLYKQAAGFLRSLFEAEKEPEQLKASAVPFAEPQQLKIVLEKDSLFGGSAAPKKTNSSNVGESQFLIRQAERNVIRTKTAMLQTQSAAPASPAAQAAQRAYYEAQRSLARMRNDAIGVQQGGSSALMQMQMESQKLQSITFRSQILASGAIRNRCLNQGNQLYRPVSTTPNGTTTASPTVSGVGNGRVYDCGLNIKALGAGDYGFTGTVEGVTGIGLSVVGGWGLAGGIQLMYVWDAEGNSSIMVTLGLGSGLGVSGGPTLYF